MSLNYSPRIKAIVKTKEGPTWCHPGISNKVAGEIKMNERFVLCSAFSVHVLVSREGIYLISATLPPCSRCKWPRFYQYVFPTVLRLAFRRKKEQCCSCLYLGGCLSPSNLQALSGPNLTSSSPAYFLWLWPPKASCSKLRSPCRGARLSPSAYFESKTQGALSELIVTALTASPQKRLNACSLIIWILVNWINCWIETVLLKVMKTQGQGEQKGGD